MADDDQQHLILLADTLINSAKQVQSSKFDCSDVTKLASQLTHLLRATARLLATSPAAVYHRPLRSISSDVAKNLRRAQTLVRKCNHRTALLRHVFAVTTAADIRKVSTLLESSIADVKWLLSILVPDDSGDSGNSGADLSLPPIAANDPILAWVWSNIATLHHTSQLRDRVDAANSLAAFAGDSDRNKKMIVEEDGIPPLLKLLREGASEESQIAAVAALYNLAADQEKIAAFVRSLAVPTIVQVLNDSSTRVRTEIINLVSKLVEIDTWVQEEFGKENVIRPIVTFLGIDIVLDDHQKPNSGTPTSIHSLVQIKMAKNSYINGGLQSNSSLSLLNKQERDVDSPEEKLKLKISCGRALWKLAKGCLLNCRKITETKALICLAKLIENESGELQVNCLMAVMELASMAESNAELRRQAFKPSSPAARAVLNQLLRVINQENNPKLVVNAIKSIGSLARTFPAKETRIIGPLVKKMEDVDGEVAIEAVRALGNFVCPDNFNCVEHSKAIVDFNGVPPLMSFLKSNDHNNSKSQIHGLKLLCFLALNVGNNKAFEQVRALAVIEGAFRSVVNQYPYLKEVFAKAIHHLHLYQAKSYVP